MTNPGPEYTQQSYQPNDPTATPTGTPAATPAEKKRAVSTGQILAGLLLILVVVFIAENSRKVKIRLIFPEVTAPLYVAILIAAVLGGVIGALLRYRRHRNHR